VSDPSFAFMQKLGGALDDATSKHHLPNPAETSSNPNQSDTGAYIRAVRARLIELGYLGVGKKASNRVKAYSDSILIKKIKRFQQDVGLKVDGWAGAKTWQVLECLMSFENQQTLSHWQQVWQCPNTMQSNPAVMRAAYCRLYAMGFFADWDKMTTRTHVNPTINTAFRDAILRFSHFARRLSLVSKECDYLCQDLLSVLFDYDTLLTKLREPSIFNTVEHNFAQNLHAITRIELWLIGYDIMPGKEQFKTVPVRRGKKRVKKQKAKTLLAIKKFCIDYGLTYSANSTVLELNPVIFGALTTLPPETDELEQAEHSSDEINESVAQILARPHSRQTFHRQFKQLANGIFDGIKRAARWLWSMIKRVVTFSREFIANIARYVSKTARKYYLGIVNAFDIVYSGLSYLKQSVYSFRHPPNIVFSRDNDFDQFCLIAPNTSSVHILSDIEQYTLGTKMYAAGIKILAHVIKITHKVIQSVSNPVGWLLAMLSLSNLSHSIAAIKHEIQLVQRHELDLSHKGALFNNRIS
jgi:hypothetical protein